MKIMENGKEYTPKQIKMKLEILGDDFHLRRFIKFLLVCDFCKFKLNEPIIMNGTKMCHIASMYDELVKLGEFQDENLV